jgi:mannose/fructose/N-acetylgalactosamine-specific phosphotransferase system component IIB
MPLALHRIDDRLIHGQVVVGWGQPLSAGFIVLVDDSVAASDWEQELYRMGVPPRVDVIFAGIDDAAEAYPRYLSDPRNGILLTGDVWSMVRLSHLVPSIRAVNVGGIHHRADRVQKLRYVFLTEHEEKGLRELARNGVDVTAQDVPATRPVSLDDILRGES